MGEAYEGESNLSEINKLPRISERTYFTYVTDEEALDAYQMITKMEIAVVQSLKNYLVGSIQKK